MCAFRNAYERFGRELERCIEKGIDADNRYAFIFICLRAGVCPAEINRVLESELGLDGDALVRRLLC